MVKQIGVTFSRTFLTPDTRTSDVIVMYVNVIDGVRSRIGKSEKLYGPANGPATRVLAWRDRDSLLAPRPSSLVPLEIVIPVRYTSASCTIAHVMYKYIEFVLVHM
jgi:hypothetical protein